MAVLVRSIPRFSSILSAYGMALADVTVDLQEAVAATLNSKGNAAIEERKAALREKGAESLRSQGFADQHIEAQTYYNCHFAGATTYLMIKVEPDMDLVKAFQDKHFELFGFILEHRDIRVESVRVRAIGLSQSSETRTPYAELQSVKMHPYEGPSSSQKVYFDGVGWQESKLIALADLKPGAQVAGPAIIYDKTQTILVEPTFVATTLSKHVIIDKLEEQVASKTLSTETVDPVQLSVFSHRSAAFVNFRDTAFC